MTVAPVIGLALIAKDEQDTLPQLLPSVLPFVDYAVLCDTGSTDRTKEIFTEALEEHGCQGHVVDFDWCDDFAAARQASYDALPEHVTWTLWADADDVLVGAERLWKLAADAPPGVAGFLQPYDYAFDPDGNCICYLERERLVRRGIGERWQLPVHEVLRVPGQLVRDERVRWVHRRPPERSFPTRNYDILTEDHEKAEAEGRPTDPRTLVYLGTECMALGKWDEAVGWLERYLDAGSWDEELCQAAHKLSLAQRARGAELLEHDPEQAQQAFVQAELAAQTSLAHRPDFPDGYLDLAELALRRGDPAKALLFLDRAKALGAPQTLLITNPLDYTLQPLVMAASALAQLGRTEEALAAAYQAREIAPQRQDLQAEAFRLSELVKADETVRHVLALRELLVRHDENLKALRLLENVPYYVADRPEIAQARLDCRENVLHATDPEAYQSYYRGNPNEAPFELQGVEIEQAHEHFRRVEFLRRGLKEQAQALSDQGERRPLRILDLSGNDGWVAANLSTIGFRCDMIEMNEGAAARAKGRRKQFPGMGRVVCGNLFDAPQHFRPGSYDAVVMFETVEHIPDVGRGLRAMEKMVRPGGRCYLSTPEGAFERGRDPIMANWHLVEQKGHLRACPASEVAGWGCSRGVVHDFALEQRLACICWEPNPRKGRVVFYAGAGWDDPLPEKLLTQGMGGSETALCKLAELFARKGYDVRVYAGHGEGGLRSDSVTIGGQDEANGQVLYAPHSAWDPGEPCDLFVSSRMPEAFDRTIKAPRRVLWLHDADYADRITDERVSRMTDVVVLSQFQRELLTGRYPAIAPKIFLSRNGIEPRLFQGEPPERQSLVAYTSSPDRGLDVLLSVWPKVLERVPGAKLEAAYSPVYHLMAGRVPELGEFHRSIERMLDQPGVTWHSSLTQPQVADLYRRARVWAYPSYHTLGADKFPEISCITAMEAQAGGAIPVCLDHAALKETVATGERIDGDPASDEWRGRFVDAIVRGLTDDAWLHECGLRGRTYAMTLGWDDVAHIWEQQFLTSDEAYEARAAA